MPEQSNEILVVHSLRQAQEIFRVGSPSTIQQWCLSGRLDGVFENKRWTIRIPSNHPDLPANRPPETVSHHPSVESVADEREAELARLRAQLDLLRSERDFLREQQLAWQRTLPDLVARLVQGLQPPALPAPPEPPRRWWHWLSKLY